MTKRIKLFFALATTTVLVSSLMPVPSQAAFSKSLVIDDAVFSSKNSMSASQINSFLNSKPNSCISPNSGFTAKEPTGYSPSGGYKYGSYVTAGKVIYSAAQAYDISPRVLLVTLQKEQSLPTGSGGCTRQGIAAAMGYGCPDNITSHDYSGVSLYRRNGHTISSVNNTCVNAKSKAGFSQQVIRAAWLLKFGQQRSKGNVDWAIIRGDWNNSDDLSTCYGGPMTRGTHKRCPDGSSVYYDGYQTIDGEATLMRSGATASMYWYTPHFHGNQLFVSIYNSWFGSTISRKKYDAGRVTGPGTSSTTMAAGTQKTVSVQYVNRGSRPWFDISSYRDYGSRPTILRATHIDGKHESGFNANFAKPTRATQRFAEVYNDGVPKENNTKVVQPDQTVEFSFVITASADLSPGTYRIAYQPVIPAKGSQKRINLSGVSTFYVTVEGGSEGSSSESSDEEISFTPGNYEGTRVRGPGSSSTSMQAGAQKLVSVEYVNTGDQPWYDVSSALANNTRLTTLRATHVDGSNSGFNANFATETRATQRFATVYHNGTPKVDDPKIAEPGEKVKFSFTVTAPADLSPGTYRIAYQPVIPAGYGFPRLDISSIDTYYIYITE